MPNAQLGLAGKQAATGSGENTDESASALLAKQVGSDGAINTDASTSALAPRTVAKTAMPRLAATPP